MGTKEKITFFLNHGTSSWTGEKIVRFPTRGNPVFVELLERYREELDYVGIKIFFEAGTFNGNNAADFANIFEKVITTEISEGRYKKSKHKHQENEKISFVLGDATEHLRYLLKNNPNERMVILLDDHNVHESYIKEELTAIEKYSKTDHIIIIDDAYNFGVGTYPTIEEIQRLVELCGQGYKIIKSDGKLLVYKPTTDLKARP